MKTPENFTSTGISRSTVRDAIKGKSNLSLARVVGLVGHYIPSECAVRIVMYYSAQWKSTGEYEHEVDYDATVAKGRQTIVRRVLASLVSQRDVKTTKTSRGETRYSLDRKGIAERQLQSQLNMEARTKIGPLQAILRVDTLSAFGTKKQEMLFLQCGHWILRHRVTNGKHKWARCASCKAGVEPYFHPGKP